MKPGQRAVAGQLDEPGEADPLLDLGALGRGALVVPQDRGAQHVLLGVEDDEPVHLARQADRPFAAAARATSSAARHQSSGSCSAQSGCGRESG